MLFSVIVPVYNVQQYLDECIRSVLTQSKRNFELILIDDGSTDESGHKCDEWAAADPRIRVLHQTNQGLAAARNAGIYAAQGEYLLFLDSDDYWPGPQELEKLTEIIQRSETQLDAVLCAFQKKDLRTGRITQVPISVEAPDIIGSAPCKKTLLAARQYSNSACAKVVRKGFLLEKGIAFPVGKKSEDLVYSRKILTEMKAFALLRDPLFVYQINRKGSITTSFDEKNYRDILEQMQDDLQKLKTEKAITQELGKAFWAEQACWFLGYLPLSGEPLRKTISESKTVFNILTDGLSNRSCAVKWMVAILGKRITVKMLNAYLFSTKHEARKREK